ncbi:degenerin deg-1-like isoform X2 [Stegodyphus dumicola]|uniref:degenerin deg-1-like isoform X2 n=1 Tax=Stegodyphus dumicola TaxID=202533 RepID=UPI0015A9A723|nr:degenerin deg-1-like isoform X2 [Stegodyphus dumicola]
MTLSGVSNSTYQCDVSHIWTLSHFIYTEQGNQQSYYDKERRNNARLMGACQVLDEEGIRLTLNIERDQYWDLISSEFGVRLLVHPQGTYPTLQRGGIIVSPGRSVHIGVKRKVSRLLPGRERTCTETFEDSLLIPTLKAAGLDFDLSDIKYTYEHCNTLCQNTLLFDQCDCLDEQPRTAIGHSVGWKFCNPCNKTQSKCRSTVLRNFSDNGSVCDEICKPACRSIRYDVSLSKADWPNLGHQQLVMNRSRDQWNHLPEALGLLDLPFDDANISDYVNETFFSENLLRVHLFIEEMIYMSVEEEYSYQLPKLMADLGGCLGLYLGVSVISIIEIVEFFGCATIICLLRTGNHSRVQSSNVMRNGSLSKRRRRNKNRALNENISLPFLNYRNSQKRSQGKKVPRASEDIWRPSVFSYQDPYYEDDSATKRHQIRRF